MKAEVRDSRFFVPPAMLVLVSAAAVGILADRALDVACFAWIMAMVISAACWAWMLKRGRIGLSSMLFLMFVWICLGGCWNHVWWNCYPANEIGRFAALTRVPVKLRVRLAHEPRRMANQESTPLSTIGDEPRSRFSGRAIAIHNRGQWQPASGNVEVFVNGIVNQGTGGDEVELIGAMSQFEPPGNPGQFDFVDFRRGQRTLVWIRVHSADAITVSRSSTNWLGKFRATLRQYLDRAILSKVPEFQSPVASAILLGDRLQISPDERDLFLRTGTIHILAISGLHIGIMAGGLFLWLRLGILSRRTSLGIVAGMVLVYAWMVGFGTPVTRAAILIALFCIARMLGAYARSITILGFAGLLVLAMSPANLLSAGTQLSFLAVAILVRENRIASQGRVGDPLKNLIRETRPGAERLLGWVADVAWQTIRIGGAIWIHAIPLVALRFHLFSPIALIVNPLIMLPMALALYGGMLIMLFSGWMFPLAFLGGWLCGSSLNILRGLIDTAASVPGGNSWVAGPSVVSVVVYYLVLATIAHKKNSRGFWRPMVWIAIWALLGWYLPFQISALAKHRTTSMDVAFVDVGHGTATVIQLPHGRVALYDGGSFGSVVTGVRNISGVLWAAGIQKIDDVIISHADIDHFNAIPDLCDRFSIKRVWIGADMDADDSASVGFLKLALQKHKIQICVVNQEQLQLDLGPGVNAVFYGPGNQDFGSDNANSLVLQLGCDDSTTGLILTGDVEGKRIGRLGPAPNFRFTIAAAPHHGSLGSRPQEFCMNTKPDLVVVSADRDKLDPRSLLLYQDYCPRVLSTSCDGAIRIRLQGDRVAWKTWAGCGRSTLNWNANACWNEIAQDPAGNPDTTNRRLTNTRDD